MSTRDDAGFRSLADQLRSWDDDRLAGLLVARPDLTTPAPHDFGQLASRATVRASLARALDTLTRLELSVLDALVVAGQTTATDVRRIIRAEPAAVDATVARLLDLALVWETRSGLRAVSGAADALGTGPGASGLRPRSAEPLPVREVTRRLAAVSPAARAMLDHVADHGGEATAGAARLTVLPEDAATPAEELVSRRLLVPRAGTTGTVQLPGEVGLALRGGRTTTERVDVVPPLATAERSADLVDRAAAGAAFELVRRVELLLDHWGSHPPGVLRSGGLAVRDLKTVTTLLSVDQPTAALVVETCQAAGLLAGRAGTNGDPVWVPTDAFDTWLDEPPAARWVTLARAWLDSPRLPGLVGTRDEAGKTWNALAPELSSYSMAETRAGTLAALATMPPGTVLAATTGLPSLVEQVAWHRPRRPRSRTQQVAWTMTEAAGLGVTGLDGIASYARRLIGAGDPEPGLAALLPSPVDHVLIQADLTAVAPGPLESALARSLQLVADVESRGGATVYRFTPSSVRRALDVGWTAVELHDFLGKVSRTPVPQPLTYLVDDTVRTFGTIRVGTAESFLRADDEAALSELLHHPKARGLGLRRIAPTVVVSTTPVDVLLPRLRELGAAPVVEAADGTVQVTRPDALRARSPRERGPSVRSVRESARVASVVAAVRSGDRAASARPTAPATPLTPSGALAALREALESGTTVLIGYVDNQGVSSDRVVDPISVEGGSLTARDHRADDVRAFAVHRITTVRPLSGT
ncbi:helicase C-terminal domain-containing protein [Nocardioides sp.]|uniref:helicase C-terminal domain-containing protein n=1 Tax=Nocardioides sp. TaxID=35761 RepID=UPI00271E30C3|nr:helicase C-terminal domain-containing protein [Nocardioides sp.]MDO9456050.1 helicase C-terminal domain-containing protein [Nocardioides sp.]